MAREDYSYTELSKVNAKILANKMRSAVSSWDVCRIYEQHNTKLHKARDTNV